MAHIWWYVARASGGVAWALLSISVLWGVLLSTRERGDRARPAWLLDLHRWLGALSVIFTGFHLAGLLLDSYVQFTPAQLFVPFLSTWHPLAVAWGIVAFWFLLAVQGTSLIMNRLPRRLWRAVHMTSYGLFWVASIHGFTAGTDRGSLWFRGIAIVGMTIVLAATVRRLLTPPPLPVGARAATRSR
jgi:predicted ferric reductase